MDSQTQEYQQNAQDQEGNQELGGENPQTFDEWLGTLPKEQAETARNLYQKQLEALISTVKATRKERDDFAKKLRDVAKNPQLDELKSQISEMAARLENESRRAQFFEQALTVDCNNPRAAYLLAKSGEMFEEDGKPDWKAIREEAPQLFGQVPRPSTNGGSGTNSQPHRITMDDFIRRKAKE